MSGTVPRLLVVDLPRNVVGNAPSLIIGTNELYPPSLIFEPVAKLERDIDEGLQYKSSRRVVIAPIAIPMTDARYTGWGLSAPLGDDPRPFVLAFLASEGPATRPPVAMMTIVTPPGLRDIIIMPKPNFDFVTSGDVQREVVRWMREIAVSSQLSNERTAMSKAERFYLPDGREIDIELWQWKGLKKHGLESDVWDLYL